MLYRREIDGLRGVAVLVVVLFHAGFLTLSGGFVGVDVFFVISGYLITTILINELQEGRFSIAGFYERRARRILPALFVVMLACLPLAWLWLFPKDLKKFTDSIMAVIFFLSNHLFSNQSNYFDTATELKPLLHTWSLAVEEQYYLLFPLILMATWKLGQRWVLAMLITLIVSSLLLAQWMSAAKPELGFYILPTRAWELLIGGLVAFYVTHPKRQEISAPLNQGGSLLGLALLIYAVLAFNPQTPFPSVYALVPTVGAALIILCANPATIVGRLLGHRFLVGIGLISYSAYLWHQPLFAFTRYRYLEHPGQLLLGALAVLSFILGYLTWRFVETPFRNKQRFTRRQIFIYSAIGSVFFIIIGVISNINRGFTQRIPDVPGVNQVDIDIPKITNGWCFYSVDSIKKLNVGEDGLKCWLGDSSKKTKALLFGDSFAAHYEPFWDVIGKDKQLSINSITTNWCHPSTDDSFSDVHKSSRAYQQCLFNRDFLIKQFDQYDIIILSANWPVILGEKNKKNFIELIETLSRQSKPIILMPNPKQFNGDVMAKFMKSYFYKSNFDISQYPASVDAGSLQANAFLSELAKQYKNVMFITRDTLFKNSELTDDGIPFTLEGWHISIYGSKAAAKNFMASDQFDEFKVRLKASHRSK